MSVVEETAAPAVIYDHREERCGIPRALRAAGITAAAARLPVGDYVLSDRVVVERKTGADLAASIKDRRLFEQVDRLTAAYDAVVLVIEGEPIHIAQANWKGALARVLLSGAAVIATTTPPIRRNGWRACNASRSARRARRAAGPACASRPTTAHRSPRTC